MDATSLQTIDVIFKLIPGLKSFTGERRREYFAKLIRPLYQQFEETHDFYCTAFLKTRDAIVQANGRYGSHVEDIDTLEVRRQLVPILATFFRERQTDEHLRDALRHEAADILGRIKWREERHFLVLLCYYFLQRGGVSPDAESLDREALRVTDQGGITYWDTPSMRVYSRLQEATTTRQLLEVLDEARNDLNQRYMNVRLAYKAVESSLVLKT